MSEDTQKYYRVGYYAARGAFTYISRIMFVGFAIYAFVLFVVHFPTDDTDLDARNRSGVALINDYGTGCQYLETSDGSLYPRMGADGKQLCNGEKR